MKRFVIIFFSCILSLFTSHGSKLEHWSDPNVEGSIQPSALTEASRNPKLFFETTSTSTSTKTTSLITYCFSTTGTVSANCRRKKRAINDAPNDEGYIIDGKHLTKEELTKVVSPSSTTKSVKDTLQRNERSARESKMGQQSIPLSKIEELNQLANVRTSSSADSPAEARFFLFYWYTSTVTSTSTTYTTTKTFTLTVCTPS